MTLSRFLRYLVLILGTPLVVIGFLRGDLALILVNIFLIVTGLYAAKQVEIADEEIKKDKEKE